MAERVKRSFSQHLVSRRTASVNKQCNRKNDASPKNNRASWSTRSPEIRGSKELRALELIPGPNTSTKQAQNYYIAGQVISVQ